MPKDANGRAPQPVSAWGYDYPPAMVALQSLSGPWAEPWFAEMVDEKPLPWSAVLEKEGDSIVTHFGVNYGLASIRTKPQRLHVLGHWRRKAELPKSMRDIGTLDMRIGFNQTQLANDGSGVISEQGAYRTFQDGNRLIMLAKPKPQVIQQMAAEHQYGHRKQPAQEIKSVQCTAALFSYEQPQPTWEIFVGDKKIDSLPATAKLGQAIVIRDGVSYLAIRPLSTTDVGRDAEVTLEAGQPQMEAYHEAVNVQPALLINAYFYKKDAAIAADAIKQLEGGSGGFVVEMGDEAEYGSFEKFRQHIQKGKLDAADKDLTYVSGSDTLKASWDAFTVNGKDPVAGFRERHLWQDTSLSQMGRKGLEKIGAVLDRGPLHPELNMLLQTFPKQKVYVATNMLPNYLFYSFREPGGVKIVADGACSMGRWAVKDSREIDIRYTPFGGIYREGAEKEGAVASTLFVSGTKEKPKVTLNGKDVTAGLKAWKQDGADGWLVPLVGDLPAADQIAARLTAAQALVAGK
jgi:hypothetical protein